MAVTGWLTCTSPPYGQQLPDWQGDRQLPETDQEISELWQLLNRSSSTSNLLGPVGADANERVFNQFVPEAVDNWNLQQIPGVKTDIQTPGVFFQAVEKSGIELPLIHNTEFMDEPGGSPAGTNRRVLPGSYATRIDVKKKTTSLNISFLMWKN